MFNKCLYFDNLFGLNSKSNPHLIVIQPMESTVTSSGEKQPMFYINLNYPHDPCRIHPTGTSCHQIPKAGSCFASKSNLEGKKKIEINKKALCYPFLISWILWWILYFWPSQRAIVWKYWEMQTFRRGRSVAFNCCKSQPSKCGEWFGGLKAQHLSKWN